MLPIFQGTVEREVQSEVPGGGGSGYGYTESRKGNLSEEVCTEGGGYPKRCVGRGTGAGKVCALGEGGYMFQERFFLEFN